MLHRSSRPARSGLGRAWRDYFAADTDVAHRLLSAMAPAAGSRLEAAVSNAQVTPDNLIACRVYRGKAGLFGANHPGRISYVYSTARRLPVPTSPP